MANSVTPTPPANQPPATATTTPPTARPVPGGVGSAPTQLQPSPNASPSLAEKGYLERAAIAIKNCFVAIWKWVKGILSACFCKKETAPSAAATPPPPSLASTSAPTGEASRSPPPPPQSILDRLRNMMRNEEIFSLFHTYFPEESARDDVYLQFGQAAPLSGWQSMKHAWWYGADASRKARIDMGKQMVSNAPALLVPHLIRKIEQQNVTPSS